EERRRVRVVRVILLCFDDLDVQLSERAAHYQRKQPDQDQRLHHLRFSRVDLIKSVRRLELPKEKLRLPARLIELRYISRAVVLCGQIRDVEMIPFFLVVPDADDTERLDSTATRAVVDASLEPDFTVDVDDVAVKIIENVLYLLAFEGNGVATPFPEFSRYLRVCVGFESCEEPAAVGVDQVHRAVIEVGLVEQ